MCCHLVLLETLIFLLLDELLDVGLVLLPLNRYRDVSKHSVFLT